MNVILCLCRACPARNIPRLLRAYMALAIDDRAREAAIYQNLGLAQSFVLGYEALCSPARLGEDRMTFCSSLVISLGIENSDG